MKRGLVVLALGVLGCDQHTVPIRLLTTEQEAPITSGSQHEDLVREAAGIYGYEVRFVTRKRGALTLDLHDFAPSSPFGGRTLVDEGCYRAATADPSSVQVVAHEIGHMLGLSDDDKPRNVMRNVASPENVEVTPLQQWIADGELAFLSRC